MEAISLQFSKVLYKFETNVLKVVSTIRRNNVNLGDICLDIKIKN